MRASLLLRSAITAAVSVASASCSASLEPSTAADHAESSEVRVEKEGDRNDFVFTNVSPGRIELTNVLMIARQHDGKWEDRTSHHALTSGAAAEVVLAKCISLAPGESLHSHWDRTLGWTGSCVAEDASTGTYRVFARRCGGTQRFLSAPFEL